MRGRAASAEMGPYKGGLLLWRGSLLLQAGPAPRVRHFSIQGITSSWSLLGLQQSRLPWSCSPFQP